MNMIKYILLAFTLLIISIAATMAKECFIETYPRIIMFDSIRPQLSLIKNSSCSQKINTTFLETLSTLDGKINSSQITQMINESIDSQDLDVQIIPVNITINSIRTLLKSKLDLPFDIIPDNIKLVGQSTSIQLPLNSFVNFECLQCESIGLKNIKITVSNPITQYEDIYWASTTLLKTIKVLELKNHTNAFQKDLEISMFNHQFADIEDPTLYFTNLDELKFYKTNKPLKKGAFLKHSDLSPIQLIQAGSQAKLEIIHGNLKLQSIGIAKKSGVLGDTIELSNPKTKKNIIGKVINFNTVSVKL